ncbi:MAG TPA: cupredoxin domain-containing protein [Thermomicrobiales bacterium]|jgi:plastocyanin
MGAVPRRLLVVVPLLMTMLLVAPVSRPSLPRVAAQGDTASVEIQDFQFSPATLEVTVGTTVTWTNAGNAPHTVTSDDGVFDSGQLSNGQTFSFTFDQVGTFAYHCNIHPQMTAQIVVKEAAAAPPGKAVSIKDFQFSPASRSVIVGTTVTWTNTGDAPHTVTSDDGVFDSGRIEPGDDFSFTFDQVGTFTYHCAIHPRMKGKIVVKEANTAQTANQTAGNATGGNETGGNETAGNETGGNATGGNSTGTPNEQASPAATEAPTGPATIVGGATDGNNALEYVGRLDQRGADLTIYGYLTHIAGLEDTQLFADADPTNWNEGTARFTFVGNGKVTSRAVVENEVIATTAEGSAKFFLNDSGGGSWEVPESFLSGTQIAEANVRVHDVLSVYDTAKGIANGDASLVWTSDDPFALDGQNYQLGKVDGKHRLTFSGLGTLQDENGPRATISIGGSSVSIAAPAAAAEASPEAGGNTTAGTPQELTVNLNELNDSGISGTATLKADGDKTDVELNLQGATGGHPAHIHNGTCTDLDPNPKYPLETVDANGHSQTTIDVSLADLLASPFAINVHKSAEEIGIYVACGEIGK